MTDASADRGADAAAMRAAVERASAYLLTLPRGFHRVLCKCPKCKDATSDG